MNDGELNLFSIQRIKLRCLLKLTLILLLANSYISYGQTPAVNTVKKSSLEREFFKNIVKDQKEIWTSPFHFKKHDLNWFIPLTVGTAALISTDRRTAGSVSNDRSRINFSLNVSRFGSIYADGGTALSFYAIGKLSGNRRAQETGLLTGEGLINSGIVVVALKFISQRPRPLKKNGRGVFFTGGNSFPSGHSASVWAVAAVIADEYGQSHPFIKYGVYGLATAVSLSRYTARRHFLSDVLVGGAIGYGIGHFTYLRHHDADLDSSSGVKKTTKLEKYFPFIAPQYDGRAKSYGLSLAWNL